MRKAEIEVGKTYMISRRLARVTGPAIPTESRLGAKQYLWPIEFINKDGSVYPATVPPRASRDFRYERTVEDWIEGCEAEERKHKRSVELAARWEKLCQAVGQDTWDRSPLRWDHSRSEVVGVNADIPALGVKVSTSFTGLEDGDVDRVRFELRTNMTALERLADKP